MANHEVRTKKIINYNMIKITQEQKEFLKNELGIETIPEEKAKIEKLLSQLAELLSAKGLQENSEPNDYGLKIEELIGIFSKEVYQ
jgi:hypothetical protein